MNGDGNTEKKAGTTYIIPNLDRALKVLELLSTKRDGSSVTEIAKALGLPKNSVFRIVRTLASNGYLLERDRIYRFSPKILSLGYAGIQSTNLIGVSLKGMRGLRDEVNETIFIGTIVQTQVVILEQLPSYQHVKFTIEIGHRVPIHASAPGKAILSFLPEGEQKELLNHIAFTRYTDTTIPGMKVMLREIEKIKTKGYALDYGEEVAEIYCVASPVLDYREYPIASLWLAGPAFRLSVMDLEHVGTVVREHALRISREFGYDPSLSGYAAFSAPGKTVPPPSMPHPARS